MLLLLGTYQLVASESANSDADIAIARLASLGVYVVNSFILDCTAQQHLVSNSGSNTGLTKGNVCKRVHSNLARVITTGQTAAACDLMHI